MRTEPIEVTDASFAQEVLQSRLPVLLDCWAPQGELGRGRRRVIEELAADLSGTVKVAKLNVDENPESAERLGIRSVPMLLLFRNGKVIGQAVGAARASQIEAGVLCRLSRP